jgi:hypothetical protein
MEKKAGFVFREQIRILMMYKNIQERFKLEKED